MNILKMVHAFRLRGHFAATLDPLSLSPREGFKRRSSWLPEHHENHPDVCRAISDRDNPDLSPFGLESLPMNSKVDFVNSVWSQWTIGELILFLSDAYCGNVGVEYLHIENGEYCVSLKT